MNRLLRFPWRSRVALLALINSVAGVFLTMGFSTDEISPVAALAVAFVVFLADLGVVVNGEEQTTPVDDPLGRDGWPLVPWGTSGTDPLGKVPEDMTTLNEHLPFDQDPTDEEF